MSAYAGYAQSYRCTASDPVWNLTLSATSLDFENASLGQISYTSVTVRPRSPGNPSTIYSGTRGKSELNAILIEDSPCAAPGALSGSEVVLLHNGHTLHGCCVEK